MTNKRKTAYSDLVCLECGNVSTIYRVIGRLKKFGHIKHLYCPNCMDIKGHYEVRDISLFMLEYENYEIDERDTNAKTVYKFLTNREEYDVGRKDRVFKKVLKKQETR